MAHEPEPVLVVLKRVDRSKHLMLAAIAVLFFAILFFFGFSLAHARAAEGYAKLLFAVSAVQMAFVEAYAYNGTVPGPLLRVRRGQELKVRLVNALPEATVVHWHGVRLPNAMDGAPHVSAARVKAAPTVCRWPSPWPTGPWPSST